MLSAFLHHVHNRQLFAKPHRLLLAISGGVDSVVLAHLLKMGDFNFALAHCNFSLRGKESDADESFCKALATRLSVPFYSIRFDAATYARSHKLSIQVAARNLRYNWFNEILSHHAYDFLLTAHHADDAIETMLLNLVRGTGLQGLKGIPEKNGHSVRPLLPFHKTELESFAKTQKLKFRLDSSNLKSQYDRNFIRLKVLPLLARLNPSIEKTLAANLRRFAEENQVLQSGLQDYAAKVVSHQDGVLVIDREALLSFAAPITFLHHVLSPLGFNDTQCQDLLTHLNRAQHSGKQFLSKSHQLSIDRSAIRIRMLPAGQPEPILIHDVGELHSKAGFRVLKAKQAGKTQATELYLSQRRLFFPLLIRALEPGDKFKPFGMKGFKLLSDFLRAEKLERFEKEACRVLVNGNGEIIWLIGIRSDERYRITEAHSDLIKLIRE